MPLILGTTLNDVLTGTGVYDVIVGLDGDDTIDDGGGTPDELVGGNGNDIYIIRSAGSTIVETADGGFADTVRTALASYRLPANIEGLEYSGGASFSGIGNAGNNSFFGGIFADTLIGLEGNDSFFGGTGAANTLIGGPGDDTYRSDAAGDTIIELPNEGVFDVIFTRLQVFFMPANVEYLTYVNNDSASFIGVGNDGDNEITGSFGADTLVGFAGRDNLYGGTGAANTLIGGIGDDNYYADAAGDTLIELPNEGRDTVLTTRTAFVLPSNFEELRYRGTGPFNGVGNAADNALVGGSGGDTLVGLDGNDQLISSLGFNVADSAANTLIGGLGDDRYNINTVGDSIVELAGEGHDTVTANVASYTLPAFVEDLIFVGGTGGISGVGNALANRIDGGFYDDVLSGLDGDDRLNGGFGDDLLFGGFGSDTIDVSAGSDTVFLQAGDTGVDTILNFSPGLDRIAMSRAAFGLTATVDFFASFGTPPVPTSTNSTLLLDIGNVTRTLSLDLDGTGPMAAFVIAQFQNSALTGGDFAFY
jgi:serralysin